MPQPDLQSLFRDVADLPPAERQRYYEAHRIPADAQQEVESLIQYDSPGQFTAGIAETAMELLSTRQGLICGAYRLVRLLGQGGMGAVYLAERSDGELNQRAAIKLLRDASAGEAMVRRFLRERQILASLDHPNIARLLDAGHTKSGQPFLIMEYVEGQSFDPYIEPLALRARLDLFLQLCDAVAHAHRNLVIHRDLKPANIIIDASGRLKLLDFGIARMLDDSAPEATKLIAFTPEYASPEQLRGAASSTSTDIFSLGAILRKVIGPNPPKDLASICAMATREEPSSRYPSVEALRADIDAYLKWKPVQASSGNTAYIVGKFVRRNWAALSVVTLAIAALLWALVVIERERHLAEQRFAQVRSLANEVFGMDRWVRELPGSTNARAKLADLTFSYLERASANTAGDPRLAFELGAGYIRIARIQGVPIEQNLGNPKAADQSLAKALPLLMQAYQGLPPDPEILLTLSEVHELRMILSDTAKQRAQTLDHGRQVRYWLDRAVAALPHPNPAQLGAIMSRYSNVALNLVNNRNYADAIVVAKQAIGLSHQPMRQQGSAYTVLANALRFEGNLDGALAAIRSARAISPKPAKDATLSDIRNYASNLWREAVILGQADGVSLGRSDEAIALLEEEMGLLEKMAVADLKDSVARTRLATAARELAPLLEPIHPERALDVYDLAIRRLSEIPSNPANALQKAELEAASAVPLRTLKRQAEATRRIENAISVLPVSTAPLELGQPEANILLQRANHLSAVGNASAALVVLDQLLARAQQAQPSQDLRDANAMHWIYRAQARALQASSPPADTDPIARKATQLWLDWDKKLPNNPVITARLASWKTFSR